MFWECVWSRKTRKSSNLLWPPYWFFWGFKYVAWIIYKYIQEDYWDYIAYTKITLTIDWIIWHGEWNVHIIVHHMSITFPDPSMMDLIFTSLRQTHWYIWTNLKLRCHDHEVHYECPILNPMHHAPFPWPSVTTGS